jgi:hypothetical protein
MTKKLRCARATDEYGINRLAGRKAIASIALEKKATARCVDAWVASRVVRHGLHRR